MTTRPIVPPGVGDFREEGARPAIGWETPAPAGSRLVPTHCCYCGVQCGMYLRVDPAGRVFGMEPRDHEINRMKLCPKGVTAYQQVNHPDRLLYPLVRDRRDAPLRRASWDEALDRVASEITRIQGAYGRDAFAVYSGSSLATEVTYLMGKFARVALRTKNIDYNGRLCMVSAAAANKKAFGIDRAANPWSDMLDTQVILVAGSNVAECFPVMSNYVWAARDRGAKLVVIDPRETPLARTADLFVPVRPGTDSALFNGVLHVIDREGWLDERFIADRTVGWDDVRRVVAAVRPCPGCGDLRDRTSPRGGSRTDVGDGRSRDGVPCPGDRAPDPGRGERAVHHQPRARDGPDRCARQGVRDHHGPGKRSGRSRARAEDRPAAGSA